MISRIEKYDNSPTLSNFMKYIETIGVDLVIQNIDIHLIVRLKNN